MTGEGGAVADDAELAALLGDAGASMSASAVRALIEGVAAAPPGAEPEAWLSLVMDDPPAALARHLGALAAARRAAEDSGLGISPAPPARLAALRAELARLGVDGFVVPLADEHQGEFIARRAQRLAWLTGFTGSAGLAVVLADRAAIFVDGRYTLQVRAQVDPAAFAPHHLTESPPADWIAANLPKGAALGYDPWLHTADGVARLRAGAERAGGRLAPLADNPIDAVWTGQPPPPLAPVFAHPEAYAGRSSADKRREIAAAVAEAGADAAALSAPDSIAWLLNLRGGDVANTPIAYAFAVIGADGAATLYIDPRKLTRSAREALGETVALAPPDAFAPALDALGRAGSRVLVDPAGAPSAMIDRLTQAGTQVIRGADPCQLPKACKNAVELAGMRAAHVRDGVALARFLAWLAREGPGGRQTEISAAETLGRLRAEGALYRGPSFETISGAGPNGAIVHYRVDAASNRALEPGCVYLVDSGAQYLDGTTDVTRTVLIGGGGVPDEARERFTRVLKGHIALARARFPVGTSGAQLDTLARAALWRVGLDFDHGTGHGVGCYLGVHEGPARIGKQGGAVPLRPGMVLSDEPGYYRAGAYGIRIENLVAVREAEAPAGAERPLLEFETLTLAPIERTLIDPALLDDDETAWLDAYHARVRETVGPLLGPEEAAWLAEATKPLA